ncbi:MAG: DUF1471 domain-containing protein [Enterobacteriaceae bacterium]|nr:DUF1471 domain-containing protein [Enterobacteriaceae bacterium]
MNISKTLVIASAVSCLSFSALSATVITQEQATANNYEKIGVVNIATKGTGSEADIIKKLSKLADEKGGKYFVIVTEKAGNQVEALADVYK